MAFSRSMRLPVCTGIVCAVLLIVIAPFAASADQPADEIERKFRLARALASKGKFDDELAVLNDILLDKPGNERALLWRGQALLRKGYNGLAIKDFTTVLKTNHNNIKALLLRGQYYARTREFEKAVPDLTKVIALDPNNNTAYFWRGVSRAYHFDMQDAHDDFQKSLAIKPTAQAYFSNGATLVNLDRLDDAVVSYTKTLSLNPRHGLAYMIRGRCYYNLKNYRKAIKDYSLGMENNKAYWRIFMLRGQAYEAAGDVEKARSDFDQASVNEPEFAESFFAPSIEKSMTEVYRARSKKRAAQTESLITEAFKLRGKHDYEGAVRLLTKAIDLNPEDISPRLWRGRVFLDAHRYDDALEDFHMIVHSADLAADQVNKLCGLAFFGKKDYPRALCACNASLFWDQDWLSGYFYKAAALEALNRKKEALVAYKRFLEGLKNPKAVKRSGESKTDLEKQEKVARTIVERAEHK